MLNSQNVFERVLKNYKKGLTFRLILIYRGTFSNWLSETVRAWEDWDKKITIFQVIKPLREILRANLNSITVILILILILLLQLK